MKSIWYNTICWARVLELADRHVWGACVSDVRVQVPFRAPKTKRGYPIGYPLFVFWIGTWTLRGPEAKQNAPVARFAADGCADGYRTRSVGSSSSADYEVSRVPFRAPKEQRHQIGVAVLFCARSCLVWSQQRKWFRARYQSSRRR